MSSRMTLSLLTTRPRVALPTCGPPTRKNTSLNVVGSAGSLHVVQCGCPATSGFPTVMRAAELTVPASMVNPAISTPLTLSDAHRHSAVHSSEGGHAQSEHHG